MGIKFLPVSHEITLHRAIARSRRGRRLYNVGEEFWKVASKWVSGAVNLGEGDANNIVVSLVGSGEERAFEQMGFHWRRESRPSALPKGHSVRLPTTYRSLKMNINPSLVIPQ